MGCSPVKCELHILPLLGAKRLSELTVPAVYAFADQLREGGISSDMIKRVVRSLGCVFKEARRRGLATTAPTAGVKLNLPSRGNPRPVIPSKQELQAIIANAQGRWRPIILVAIFCGLRASELRGLRWADINFESRLIEVAQRADAARRIGMLKSKAGYRSIPCPPIVLNALREWKLACPKGDLDLAFPNLAGRVESYAILMGRGFDPIQKAAGVVDRNGQPKYAMHSLRHACASLWIESGHNPKQIQRLMGHSSIKVTFDVYGHLFADAEADQRAAETLQARLLGV